MTYECTVQYTVQSPRDLRPVHELVRLLVKTVALGGNLLLNIGPTGAGLIAAPFENTLLAIGAPLCLHDSPLECARPIRCEH